MEGTASLALLPAAAGAQSADSCKSLVPAAMGGPMPNDKNTLVLAPDRLLRAVRCDGGSCDDLCPPPARRGTGAR